MYTHASGVSVSDKLISYRQAIMHQARFVGNCTHFNTKTLALLSFFLKLRVDFPLRIALKVPDAACFFKCSSTRYACLMLDEFKGVEPRDDAKEGDTTDKSEFVLLGL